MKGERHMKKNAGLLSKTRNRIRNIISGLMCMALLALYAVPVSAGQYMDDMDMSRTSSTCGHVNVEIRNSDEYTMVSTGHNRVHYQKYICMDCGKLLKNYIQDMGTEGHSLSYNDLGHSDMAHEYEVYCTKCSYGYRTSTPCNGSPHKRPF